MKKLSLTVGASLFMAAGVLTSSTVLAADGKADRLQLEEVVVTASKKGFAESLQSVPISIQALTERTLEQSGAKDFMDFARLAPSVDLLPTGTGSPQVAIRGVRVISVPEQTTQEKPLTSIYLDDLPVSFANFNPNIDLFDVQRVEVLRGPQGTLYGAGAMGGNVRFVTNQPDPNGFSAKVETTVGNIDDGGETYDLKGVVNIPLIEDKMALRVSGSMHQNDGYIDNTFLNKKDWNDLERNGFRASLLYHATENLIIKANYLYQETEMDGGRNLVTSPDSSEPDFGSPSAQFYHRMPFEDEISIYNLTLEYDLDWAKFYSSTSYYDREFYEGGTVQGLIESIFGYKVQNPNQLDWTVESFVQEFRLTSNGEGKLNWVVGAYYSDEKTENDQDFTEPGLSPFFGIPGPVYTMLFGTPPDVHFKGDVKNEQEQAALFGEVTYRFNDQWELLLGLRWFDWEQEFDLRFGGVFQGGLFIIDGEKTDAAEFTPKATLSYHVNEDWMVYANAAKGYRLGGANDPVPPGLCAADLAASGITQAPTTFDPDSLWSYELGSKATLADGRVTLNAAVFMLDWEEVQTLKNLPGCGFFFTENVGEVETTGVEIEFSALLMKGMTLTLNGAFTDAALSKDVPNLGGQDGDQVPFTPELAISGSIDYTWPLSNSLDGYFRFDVQYVDDRNTEFNESLGFPLDSYQVGNLHFGVMTDRWEATIFVKNIWNEKAELSANLDRGPSYWVMEQPQTLGLTLRGNF